MSGRENMRRLVLVLTSQCNLRCGYCYQNEKKDGAMDWETLRESIDFGLGTAHEEIEFDFFGGEPLLAFPLIRKAVCYVRECRKRSSPRVYYGIATNGTLLTPEILDYFIRHDFRTQLSFDGVPSAQELRGAGTFEALDALLDRICEDHPGYLENLSIVATVTPQTVKYLAETARYFLEKGVPRVSLSPTITHTPHWKVRDFDLLDEQFERIYRASVDHFQATGTIPITDLRGGELHAGECASSPNEMCGVMRGETPAVDVNGEVHGCVMFAGATQRWRTKFLRESIESMAVGDVRSAARDENLDAFPERAKATGLFDGKAAKFSSYGACGDCAVRSQCSICPVSIGNIPGNDDPDRVPDFPCAYNLVSIKYRNRFAARTASPQEEARVAYDRDTPFGSRTPGSGLQRVRALARQLR